MKSRSAPNDPLIKALKQWKKSQAIISLTIEEMEKEAKGKTLIIEQKVDGQSAILDYKKGQDPRFGSLGGMIMWDLPLGEDIAKILKSKKIHQIKAVGEMAGYDGKKIIPFNESESLIKNRNADKTKVHWFPYQILELNGEKINDDFEPYKKSWPELIRTFKGSKYVHPVDYYQGGVPELKKAWNKLVLKDKNEGIVIRMSNNRVYKIKPIYHYDLAVIAVGSKKGKNWPKRMVGMCLMAFMDNNHVFRTAGHVASGYNDKESKELFTWAQKNKVDENDVYVWVKPKRIMEIQWERTTLKEMPAYKFLKGKYEPVEKLMSGTIVKPRFIRWRTDKTVNPNDLRLQQIPDWSEKKKMAMRVASLFLNAGELCEECKKNSNIKNHREDFYMLNNSIWNKIAKKNENLCWNCMIKRFKEFFHRDLKPSDFSEVMYSYNLGNPEVIKITGIHKTYLILAQHRGTKFLGTVTETKNNEYLEKKEDSAPTEKNIIEIRNKWAEAMKKKYSNSIVYIEGPEVLKK